MVIEKYTEVYNGLNEKAQNTLLRLNVEQCLISALFVKHFSQASEKPEGFSTHKNYVGGLCRGVVWSGKLRFIFDQPNGFLDIGCEHRESFINYSDRLTISGEDKATLDNYFDNSLHCN